MPRARPDAAVAPSMVANSDLMIDFCQATMRATRSTMMFYRRKLLLGLLQSIGRPVNKVDLQKYLFLVCVDQKKPAYEFIPHRFGCFSFQIDADKRTLTKYGLVSDTDDWRLADNRRYFHLLTPDDQKRVTDVVTVFKRKRGRALIQHVYRQYPYYAINSEIRDDVLTKAERAAVERARPKPAPARVFTIGYEGRTLEHYLRKLIDNRINVLCDVRKNPLSMKFGFSKNQLKHAVTAIGLEYVHVPALGIVSSKRRELKDQADYDALFDDYRRTTLAENTDAIAFVAKLIRERGRVAFTCFEADSAQCHRSCVVEALTARPSFRHRVIHL